MVSKKVQNSKLLQTLYIFQRSPYYVGILAAVVFVAHSFAIDLLGIYFLVAWALFTLIFNPDTKPLLPTLSFLLFCVSVKNAPNKENIASNFYIQPAVITQLVILIAPVIVLLVVKFIVSGNFKKSLKKSSLMGGLVAMSAGLVLNGLFSPTYHILNLAMGFGFAFLFLGIYFFFFSTVKWDKSSVEYLCWVMFIMGVLISAQMGVRYITTPALRLNFDKGLVTLGWSISNSIAYVLLICMPFGFYFMKKAKICLPFYLLTLGIFVAIIFTFSRGSLIVALPLAIAGVVYICFTANEKISPIVISLLILLGCIIAVIVFHEKIFKMLNFYIETGFSDRGRFVIWKNGLESFLKAPVFGLGQMDNFGYFTTFMWYHNTVIQFLVTGGVIGLGTYIYHRVETIVLWLKKPTMGRFFIGISVAALLVNSLFDVAMSIPHTVMFYSIMLAFADRDLSYVLEQEKIKERVSAGFNAPEPTKGRRKPRVLFPFVEAGLGHIVPMRAVLEVFERKYGEKVEIIRTNFYSDAGTQTAKNFEAMLVDEVSKHNRMNWYAKACFATMNLFQALSLKGIMEWFIVGSYDDCMKYMQGLDPDVVFSTHWATSYYATHLNRKVANIEYCPDVRLDVLWNTGADYILMPGEKSVARAKAKRMFEHCDIRSMPFVLRGEAASISKDKKINRELLGLPQDNFTVTMADGGYGEGRLEQVCIKAIQKNVKMTIIAICGKNKVLCERLKLVEKNENVHFVPLDYTDDMLKYIASSDLFVGKSGASSMAEPRYFGVPMLITMYATNIERDNGRYYIDEVGCAMKEFNPSLAADKIAQFAADPSLLEPFATKAQLGCADGAEQVADFIYDCALRAETEV